MLEQIFDMTSFIGALQGILLSAFLFTKGRNKATSFLASYILIFSLGLLEPLAVRSLAGELRIPVLSFLGASNFLYGPLLYLFVVHLTSNTNTPLRRTILHFVPFSVVFISETILSAGGFNTILHDVLSVLAFEGLVVQILWYNVKAIAVLGRRQEAVASPQSDRARWLKSLLVFITGIYILSFFISHLILFGWQAAEQFYIAVQVAITLMIYIMTYRLILHPELFVSHSSRMGEINSSATKYVKSGLKDDQAEEYLQRLTLYMHKEKPYLDPELSIYTLSQKVNVSRNHLTQIINEKLNKNFNEYINSYRIEEVKRMLINPDYSHLNLTGIGLECGFKSKTAFNLNFKKLTGCTPGEWKKTSAMDLHVK